MKIKLSPHLLLLIAILLVIGIGTLFGEIYVTSNGQFFLFSGTFNPSWSAGTVTDGHLACFTASLTVANCTAGPTQAAGNAIGVFDAGTGTGTVVQYGIHTVTLDNTQNVTAGDIICQSQTSNGTGHDNGIFPCTAGSTVGMVQQTATSVSSASTLLSFNGPGLQIGLPDDATGLTANHTSLYLSNYVGFAEIKYFMFQSANCASGSYSISLAATWTDPSSTSRTANAGTLVISTSQSATAGYMSGTIPIYTSAAAIQTQTTVSGSCTSGTYDFHARVYAR